MTCLLAETAQRDPLFQWVMIALAIGTILYMAVIRPAMKKKKDPLERPPAMGVLNKERTVERQMQNLLVELSEMARQISAQLDTRSQKLQTLIQDADERIAELQRLERRAPTAQAPMTQMPMAQMPVTHESIWATAPQIPARLSPPSDPVDEQHQSVYALADRGHTAGDIARELNRPRGEVELILALRPRAVS